MNREKARKAAEVMLAYADGKNVEYKAGNEWLPVTEEPLFNWNADNYRIEQKSAYRPFESDEECWQEMQKHQPFGWVKDREDGHYTLITSIYLDTDVSINANPDWSLEGIMKCYTFADGTPFGKLTEDCV